MTRMTGRAAAVLIAALAIFSSPAHAEKPGVPVTLSGYSAIDGDDLFNVTVGAPGSCSCESPRCQDGPHGKGDAGWPAWWRRTRARKGSPPC